MSRRNLQLADGLSLPLDAVTHTFAILAIRGVGKTHTASVMAEEMLKAGQPIAVYDPTGAWWGLRSSADGRQPGFSVVVFGGENADVPLEETAGVVIAETIIEKRIPAILDVSLLRKGARIRFMTDFCETLYHQNRAPLHFFVDEAHTIAPQRVFPEGAKLLGAVEDIVLQGRRRGLGVTVISQRPALVNKNITAMCNVLVAMRILGPHDRAAVAEWIDAFGDRERGQQMLADLGGLGKGDGWVWAPEWNIFKRVHFRQRETFDSSATPEVGQAVRRPKRLAEIDVAALGERIKETVQRAKENDPRALKLRIAELERQLRGVRPQTQTVEIKVPVLDQKQIDQVMKFTGVLEQAAGSILPAIRDMAQKLGQARASSSRTAEAARPLSRMQPEPNYPHLRRREQHPVHNPSEQPASLQDGLSTMERSLLTALAQHPDGLTKSQVLVLADYRAAGRTSAAFARMVREAWAEGRNGKLVITRAGLDALGPFEPLPTGIALQEHLLNSSKLNQVEKSFLRVLFSVYPNSIGKGEILEQTNYAAAGRTSAAFAKLVKLNWAVKDGRGLRASDQFFED